jgi:ubiquinone biosynthesis accessory factor UbiJ
MSPRLPHPAARVVNHLLRSTPVAMERLRRHAGRTAAFRMGPVAFALTVQTTGEVTPAVAGASHDLQVRVPPFLLPRLAAGEDAAFREIEMQGDAELAQEVAFLARHLGWDYEEDLSHVVGDIAAHRIGRAARGLHAWAKDAGLRAAAGAAEYWTEESPLIASRVKVEDFVRAVDTLREDVDRLEKRLAALSAHSRD